MTYGVSFSILWGKNCRKRCSGQCINNEHWTFLVFVCSLHQVTNIWWSVCYVVHLLQRVPIHPTWEPLEHTPLSWSYGSLFMHCRLCLCTVDFNVLYILIQTVPVDSLFEFENSYHTIPSPLTEIKVIRPKLIKHSQNTFISKIALLFLHLSPVYPGLHPLSHWPVCLLHGELFRQWPLQLLAQSYP